MKTRNLRRGLAPSWLCLMALLLGSQAAAEVRKETHVYKKVGDLEIKADVLVPAQRPNEDRPRPVLVWIHGGALIMGRRESVDRRLVDPLLAAGCVVVSIDYRLAPETKLPEIIADVEDAFHWLRRVGPDKFRIDADRLAVAGGSAGGYLTLTTGYRVQPRPKALVSLYGYGELLGPWYSQPSPHPRHNGVKVSREEAWRQIPGPPVADARDRQGNGGLFYNYCRQTGLWPKEVSGWDPQTDRQKFQPFMPLVNVTPDYPPTLLIHGDKDTDVPYEQSTLMAAELARCKVAGQLITIPNAEHGFPGGDPKEIAAAYAAAAAFLLDHLK